MENLFKLYRKTREEEGPAKLIQYTCRNDQLFGKLEKFISTCVNLLCLELKTDYVVNYALLLPALATSMPQLTTLKLYPNCIDIWPLLDRFWQTTVPFFDSLFLCFWFFQVFSKMCFVFAFELVLMKKMNAAVVVAVRFLALPSVKECSQSCRGN